VLAGLAALFIAVTGIHAVVGPVSLLGFVAFIGLLSIFAGGLFGIVAVTRRGERSLLVFAAFPVWAFAVFLLIVELAFQH